MIFLTVLWWYSWQFFDSTPDNSLIVPRQCSESSLLVPWQFCYGTLTFNKMVHPVSTHQQYINFLDACFGSYKTIFRPMLTIRRYIQCVQTVWGTTVVTQCHNSHGNSSFKNVSLTLILLTWRIWWAPNNARKWQMGFNSAFKGLRYIIGYVNERHT